VMNNSKNVFTERLVGKFSYSTSCLKAPFPDGEFFRLETVSIRSD
jgi:hypothetical protein